MQGHGAPQEPGQGERSRSGKNTGHSSTTGAVAHTPAKRLPATRPSSKATPVARGHARDSRQGTAPPGSDCHHQLPSMQQPPPPTPALPAHLLPPDRRGRVNELGVLSHGAACSTPHSCLWCEKTDLEEAASVHNRQQSSPWVCPAGQLSPGHQAAKKWFPLLPK